jgi:hypothetical protein
MRPQTPSVVRGYPLLSRERTWAARWLSRSVLLSAKTPAFSAGCMGEVDNAVVEEEDEPFRGGP